MQICLIVEKARWPELVKLGRACEEAGIDSVGLIDSALIERDVYLACAACASGTEHARIMTAVTNPITRHPSVMAASLLALSEIAPGRIDLGIATGDSALWSVGLKPARIAYLREYILALKALLRGDTAS